MQSRKTGDITLKNIKVLKNKVRLSFSDDTKLEISYDTYTDKSYYVGKEFSEKEIKDLKNKTSLEKELQYAIKRVTSSATSINELKDKLSERGVSQKDIKYILSYLEKYNLIDEKYNLNEKVEYYNYQKLGKDRIIDELYKKGFNKEDIDKIKFPYKEEFEKAKYHVEILNKKYKSLTYRIKKEKIKAYLYQKGFDSEVINDATTKVEKEDIKSVKSKLKEDYNKALISYKRKYKKEELKQKLIEYLLRKGYHYEDIKALVGGN